MIELKPVFVFAEAPSNIALIKYMGKVKGAERNRPTNPSMSLTLAHLLTRVELRANGGHYDEWSALELSGWIPNRLSDKGRRRYIAHFEFLKQRLGVHGNYNIQSANNFPSDCGIASSASSFAALTMATYKLACTQNSELNLTVEKIAELSRLGSGSSIRSFMGEFVLWNENGVAAIDIPYAGLIHQVIIVDREKKQIGSTEAHEMVTSSFLFDGRAERAAKRLDLLVAAFRSGDWKLAYEIVWQEFWDMHSLFSTCASPFQYMTADSLGLLSKLQNFWKIEQRGPLITMDAGANVHLIWRSEDRALAQTMEEFCQPFEVISSPNMYRQFSLPAESPDQLQLDLP